MDIVAKTIVDLEESRFVDLLRRLPLGTRALVQGRLSQVLVSEPYRIETPKGSLLFAVLGEKSAMRARNLLLKQPGTIEWIDSFAPDSVFWDIGANIGTYTLYAALRPDLRVVAFEPAAINHFLLSANCELNAFGERVDCLQIGVGAGKAVGRLEMSQFEGAQSFSFRPKGKRPPTSRQAAIILSIDELIEEYGLPCPNYVKIDVPGLTEAIIDGAPRTLRRPELRELHIETSEKLKGGRYTLAALASHGFSVAGRHVHRETTDLTFARHT